jgi:hypothetical protein
VKLHRSLGFWGGLLVMISVCWAWWDSRRNIAHVCCGDYVVYNVGGGLAVARLMGDGIEYERSSVRRYEENWQRLGLRAPVFLRSPVSERAMEMKPHLFSSEAGRIPDPLMGLVLSMVIAAGWICYIPFWLIAAVAGIAWGACLGWRARKMRRAMVVIG